MKFPLILDGATGTELIKRGMPRGACPEAWVLENPEVIRAIQKEYAEVGANVVLAPTFGANRPRLSGHGFGDKVKIMNEALIALSKSAVPEGVLVAADMSPCGLFIAPFGDETMESLVKIYTEQAEAQTEADLVMCETNMSVAECRAAIIAVKKATGKPVFATFTCDQNGRTMTGASALAAYVICRSLGVAAFGLNCSSGPEEMLEVIKTLTEYADIPLIAKPNAGLPELSGGEEKYNMQPSEFASFAKGFLDAGVGAIGGCCGTNPSHIKALSEALSGAGMKEPAPKREFLATEREIIPVDEAEFSEEISCSDFLADDLADCFDTCPTVRIRSVEDAKCLEENQHGASLPVCIACDEAEALSAALLSYNGRAAVKSTCAEAEEICAFYGAYLVR